MSQISFIVNILQTSTSSAEHPVSRRSGRCSRVFRN